MKALVKINRFYYIFSVVLIILAVLVIFSLRGVFSAIKVAGEIDESLLTTTIPRISTEKIDDALNAVTQKQPQPLDLKQ